VKGVYSLPKYSVVLLLTGSYKNPHIYDDDNGNCLVQSSYHGEQYPDWTEDKELKDLILELIDNGKSSIEPKCFEKKMINAQKIIPRIVSDSISVLKIFI